MWHRAEMFPRIRNYAYSDGKTKIGGNFRLSHAAPRHSYGASYNTATENTFAISGAPESRNVPSDRFNVQFPLLHRSPTHLLSWLSNFYGYTTSVLYGVFSATTKHHGCNWGADDMLRRPPYLHSLK